MKSIKFIHFIIYKKLIPVFLAGIIFLNCTVDVLAQSVSTEELIKRNKYETNQNFKKIMDEDERFIALRDTTPQWSQQLRDQYAMYEKLAQTSYEISIKDPTIHRAEEIKFLILGKDKDQDTLPANNTNLSQYHDGYKMAQALNEKKQPEPQEPQEEKDMTLEEFSAEFKKALLEQYNKSVANIKNYKKTEEKALAVTAQEYRNMGQYTEEDVLAWHKEAKEMLESWEQGAQGELAKVRTSELSQIQNRFETYKKDIAQIKQEAKQQQFEYLKKLADELLTLYKNNPDKVRTHVVELTPILHVLRIDGKKIFTTEQEALILRAYREMLNTNVKRDKNFNAAEKFVGNIIGTPDYEVLTSKHHINAISGLGMISGESRDAALIRDFIRERIYTADGIQVLLSGIAAMLSMKEYSQVALTINEYTLEEEKKGSKDWLSVATHVTSIGNTNGKYLGTVSQFAQYKDEKKNTKNAWTDVALMLAEEGSKESLNILSEYGLHKCKIRPELDWQGNLSDKFSISCGGIQPFVTGALLSGKTAKMPYGTYIRTKTAGTQEFTSTGSVKTITPGEATASKDAKNELLYGMLKYPEVLGLSREAALALFFINQGMGDIDSTAERDLDSDLYKAFKKQIDASPKAKLGEYAVVDNNSYAAKVSRQKRLELFKGIAELFDVAIMIWCAWDLSRLAYRGVTRLGSQVYHGIKLARVGSASARNAYALKHIKVFRPVVKRKMAMAKLGARLKNSMEPVVLGQRALYTSAKLPEIGMKIPRAMMADAAAAGEVAGGIGATAVVGSHTLYAEQASTLTNVLRNTSLNTKTGAYTIDAKAAYQASAGNANRVLDMQNAKAALGSASDAASARYANRRSIMEKYKSYNKFLSEETKTAFATNKNFNSFDRGVGTAFGGYVRGNSAFRVGAEGKNYATANFAITEQTRFPLFEEKPNGAIIPLGTEVVLENKVPGVRRKAISKVHLVEKEGEQWFKFVNHENKMIDPSFYKIAFDANDISTVLNTAAKTRFYYTAAEIKAAGEAAKTAAIAAGVTDATELAAIAKNASALKAAQPGPLVLKLTPKQGTLKDFFRGNLRAGKEWGKNFISSKESQYTGIGYAYANGQRLENVSLLVPNKYAGLRLESIGGSSFNLVTKEGVRFGKQFTLTLPKNQLGNFVELSKNIPYTFTPVKGSPARNLLLSVGGAKSKINSLFYMSTISLSAASTGLVGPLSKNYPDTNTIMIAVVLPYASSLLAPAISPLVRRFGSARVLKFSTGVAASSLLIPTVFKFNGTNDINEYDRSNNPSTWPLFVGAAFVGLSAALTRSSLNPLLKKYDGGGNILKSMAFKNLSSYALILPPAAVGAYQIFTENYRINQETGDYYYDANNRIARKPLFDFSLAYPVLMGASLIGLYQLQRVKLPAVGKDKDFMFSKLALSNEKASRFEKVASSLKGYGAETWNATKGLWHPSVRNVVIGSTVILGAESSLIYTYGNSRANQYVSKNITDYDPFVPILATTAMAAAPFLVRFKSKDLLKAAGGNNPAGYRKLLLGSIATSAAGGVVMYGSEDPYSFLLGLSLAGAGFASTTNSFLKIGGFNLEKAKAAQSVITSFDAAYPAVHIGMAALPALYKKMADNSMEKLPSDALASEKNAAKADAQQSNMWMPISAIAAGGIFASGGIKFKYPVGSLGAAKFLFGDPIKDLMKPKPQINELKPFLTPVNDAQDLFKNIQYDRPQIKGGLNFTLPPVKTVDINAAPAQKAASEGELEEGSVNSPSNTQTAPEQEEDIQEDSLSPAY